MRIISNELRKSAICPYRSSSSWEHKNTSVTVSVKSQCCPLKCLNCSKHWTILRTCILTVFQTLKFQSLAYQGAKIWNSLGTEVRKSSTLRLFKNEVQKRYQTISSLSLCSLSENFDWSYIAVNLVSTVNYQLL